MLLGSALAQRLLKINGPGALRDGWSRVGGVCLPWIAGPLLATTLWVGHIVHALMLLPHLWGGVLSCGLTCLARAEAGVLWLPAPDRTRPPADCGARCGKPWGRGLPAPSPGLPAPSPRGSRSPGKWPWLCLRGAKCRPAGLAVCAWAGYQPQPSLTTPSLVRRGGGHGKRIP